MAAGLVGGLALGTIVVGVPLSWFAVDIGGSAKLWHIWVVIAIVCGAGAAAVLVRNRRRRRQKDSRETVSLGFVPGRACDEGHFRSLVTRLRVPRLGAERQSRSPHRSACH